MIDGMTLFISVFQHTFDLLAAVLFPFVFLGKTGGGAPSASGAETSLTKASSEEIALGRPIRQTAMELGQTALTTGGTPDVAIPAVQRALEQVMAAASQSRQQTTDLLAKTGLDRTPYGANILANLDLQSLLVAAGIPPAIAKQYADQGLSAAGVGTQVGFSGLGTATGAATSRGIAGTQAETALTTGILGPALQGAGVGAGIYAAAPAAEVTGGSDALGALLAAFLA